MLFYLVLKIDNTGGVCQNQGTLSCGKKAVWEREPIESGPVRIGIDAHAAERDGSGNCTYIRNLLLGLSRLDNQNEYFLYITDPGHPFYRSFQESDNFALKNLPIKNPLLRIPLLLAGRTYIDNLDILHVQYNSPPAFKGKLVVTIHDLSFLHHPEFFSHREALRLKVLTRSTVRKSACILTGSQHARDDIVQAYAVNPDKVKVILHGISERFGPEKGEEAFLQNAKKYGIEPPYILFVGRLNPRKNLAALLRAFEICKVQGISHKLVIVGKMDFAARELQPLLKSLSSREDIILTGFVPDEDLPHLYSQAEVFVYPSLYEGVGLPVLEAMNSGVPIVTSNSTSLKELVGNAGILVDTTRVEDLAREILRLVADPDLKEGLREKGLARANSFSWEKTARETLDTYRQVYLG